MIMNKFCSTVTVLAATIETHLAEFIKSFIKWVESMANALEIIIYNVYIFL